MPAVSWKVPTRKNCCTTRDTPTRARSWPPSPQLSTKGAGYKPYPGFLPPCVPPCRDALSARATSSASLSSVSLRKPRNLRKFPPGTTSATVPDVLLRTVDDLRYKRLEQSQNTSIFRITVGTNIFRAGRINQVAIPTNPAGDMRGGTPDASDFRRQLNRDKHAHQQQQPPQREEQEKLLRRKRKNTHGNTSCSTAGSSWDAPTCSGARGAGGGNSSNTSREITTESATVGKISIAGAFRSSASRPML